MSQKQTIAEMLKEDLLPSFKEHLGVFNASIQEEFMETGTHFLDKNYIAQITGQNMSNKSFRQVCVDIFGTDRFNYTKVPESDLDQESFDKHYEFGKYPHCRQWVTHFAKEGIFTSRVLVLGYILDAKPRN